MGKLSPSNEPIMASTLALIVAWVVGRFALGMDGQTVDAIAVVLFAIGQYVARNFSVPVKKHDKIVSQITQAKQ